MKEKILNSLKLDLFTAALGATCGAVIWLFLRLMGLCTNLIWGIIPGMTGVVYIPVILCAAGGLIMGIIHKKYGNYPEELPVVLGKIKKDKHYDYGLMPVMLSCAFIPLVFGASVGPEAGLTGVIAGLCYWVGDNVKYAKARAGEYSEIGAAVTLGSLFHIPLFGIFAVEEPGDSAKGVGDINIPKASKLLLYGISTATAFLTMKLLGAVFGAASEGFPSFAFSEPTVSDYVLLLVYIPVGIILYIVFAYAEKITAWMAGKIPVVLKETICGLCIGAMAMIVPMVLFSGEDQMADLPSVFLQYTPLALLGICLLKILMTAFCINFGMKGGHFFPLIFGCALMGFALASFIYGNISGVTDASDLTAHAVFAAGAVTASTLGAQLKKPIAVSLLLLLCFPVRFILWIFLAAVISSKVVKAFKRTTE